MAKTTSQIQAENEIERAEIAAIQASRDAIEEKQKEDPSAYKSFSQRRNGVDTAEIQDYVEEQGQEIANDRESAAKIREEAIAAGTWGNNKSDLSTEESTSTWQEVWDLYNSYQGIAEDREDAAKIRAEAIANGTWKTKGSTEPTKTVQATESTVTAQPNTPPNYSTSILFFSIGSFVLGMTIMFVFMKLHIRKIKAKHGEQLKKIKDECDIKVNEARTALDRMLIIASQK